MAALLTGVFVATVVLRFLALSNGFVNGEFEYISGGRQILFGEWPTRDFLDQGLPFMFGASALAQAIFGQTLLAEALLTSVAFGAGAVFTVIAVDALTGSTVLAILATILEVAVFPREYSYPKVLLYAASFWLFITYATRPTRSRLVVIAGTVAVAFMFRHDHGLFLGIGGILVVLISPGRERQATIWQAITFAALVFGMLLPYLVFVEVHGGVWLYLQSGVRYSVREAQRSGPIWPGGDHPLQSLLAYELYLIPLAAIAVLAADRFREEFWPLAARIVPISTVALLVDATFIRRRLDVRLPDAIVPAVVLGAWLVSRAYRSTRLRPLAIVASVASVALFAASILDVGNVVEHVDRTGLFSRRSLVRLLAARTAELRDRWSPHQIPSRAVARLRPFFAYLDRCTTTEHRLLNGGYNLPEIPFYARRLFAGGLVYVGNSFDLEEHQRLVLARLHRQVVPFVILPSDYVEEFDARFPLIAGYVHQRYAPLTDVPVDGQLTIHILVDRDLPFASRDSETGWPCFRNQAADDAAHPHDQRSPTQGADSLDMGGVRK